MYAELLYEVKQAYCVLKQGGPPKKLVNTLVVLIESALSVCFVLQGGAREQIESEIEYLLERLGEAKELKPGFVLKRFRGLFLTLLRDKRIIPRLEAPFTSFLSPNGSEDEAPSSLEARLFREGVGWEDAEVELPSAAPYQPQEKTLFRKLRLYSLPYWEVGVFLREGKKKPKKARQLNLFKDFGSKKED